MEYNVHNLEYAVSVFYSSEQEERLQAHQWLTTAQRCPEAWSFVWDLLQTNKSTEVQFFAATTLHTKILRCWKEVPQDSQDELKNKILQAVIAYCEGPKIVLNRLCISLAAYIMQQTTSDLATILRPLSSQENMFVLLEVLTVIPEEYNSMTMGTVMRSRNKSLLQQACPAVLDDMLRHLQTVYCKEPPSDKLVESWTNAALCAASWLGLGGEETVCRIQETSVNLTDCLPLCHALLHIVHVLYSQNETISGNVLEACEAALNAVRAAATTPEASKYPGAALQLLSALAELSRPIVARDNVPNSINEELVAAVVTCAVSLGESHSRILVKAVEQPTPHEGAREFLELLLAGQASPGHYPLQETRSQLMFGFWYTLEDEILRYFEDIKSIGEKWREIYSRLLNILIEKSEAPAETSLSRDDAELLRCYRQDIADTVMYCYGVLGDWCWSVVGQVWQSATTEARREAALHVFLALGDAAPLERAPEPLRDMLRYAVHAATVSTNQRLLNTALECLGAYASWLSSLEGAERSHGALLTSEALRAAGSALEKSPQAAALALKKLSTECSASAAPLAREITMAAQTVNPCQDAWVRRQLLGAAGAALSAAEPAVALPLLQELTTMISKDMLKESPDTGVRVCVAEQAAALVTALQPRASLAADLLRSLLPALSTYVSDPALIPSLFHVLRQAITVLMDDCLPFLDEISHLTIQGVSKCPCPLGIDVVKLIVLIYDSNWTGGVPLLSNCVESCLRLCYPGRVAENGEMLQALFTALHAITKRRPQYMDSIKDLMPTLILAGSECIYMWDANLARASGNWLAVLATSRPLTLQPYAFELLLGVLKCIGGGTPRNQVEPLADLLLALGRAQWSGAEMGQWLREALKPGDFPTVHATLDHKQKFIDAFNKERNSKRRFLQSVQEFSLVCRGLIGTEYARQTLTSKVMVT